MLFLLNCSNILNLVLEIEEMIVFYNKMISISKQFASSKIKKNLQYSIGNDLKRYIYLTAKYFIAWTHKNIYLLSIFMNINKLIWNH